MNAFGRHLLAEYRGCDPSRLDDVDAVRALMIRAAIAADAHIVQTAFHRFSPQGVSGVVVIEESHLSVHTWPELGYASVDFFTCGESMPQKAHEVLRRGLEAASWELLLVHRGLATDVNADRSMQIASHVIEGTPAAPERQRMAPRAVVGN